MNPSQIPAVAAHPALEAFVRDRFDMQVSDVRTMMRLPKSAAGLSAGCNFASVNTLCDLIAGASVLFFRPSLADLQSNAGRGQRFRDLVKQHVPGDPLAPQTVADILYDVVRNPLTHSLGVGGPAALLSKAPLTPTRIARLEEMGDRPSLRPPPVVLDGGSYVIDARGLYWAFYQMLYGLFSAPVHAAAAGQLVQQI